MGPFPLIAGQGVIVGAIIALLLGEYNTGYFPSFRDYGNPGYNYCFDKRIGQRCSMLNSNIHE